MYMYLTLLPLTNEVVRYVRDDVAVLVAYGAGAVAGLGLEHPHPPLLQFSVVTVEVNMAEQLVFTLHRAEAAISP